MAKLTARAVEAWRSAAKRQEIPDAHMPGLYFIIHPTGRKGWAVRYRYGNRTRKYTIGAYPVFNLAQARDRASEVLRDVYKGREPTQRRETLVRDVVERFLDEHCKQHRTALATRQMLQRHVVSSLSWRKLEEVTESDVKTILKKADGPIIANRVFSKLRTFFNWAITEKLITVSPMADMRRPTKKEKPRERILSDDELRVVWRALPDDCFGAIVKLLVLTGQRRREVSKMEWSEVSDDTWTVPGARTKNGRVHTVPLSNQALAIITSQPHISDKFVFSINGKRPYAGVTTAKEKFNAVAKLAEPWTLHDLRRTCASGMARLGVSLPVIEKVLNHVSGSFSGIVAVYQRHDFAQEKRAALEKWAAHVVRLVELRR